MKKLFISMVMALFSLVGYGQQQQSFKGYLYNEEYQVYLRINFYDNDVLPRGQELFGKLPGYLGSKRDTRLWLITDAKLNKDNEASAGWLVTSLGVILSQRLFLRHPLFCLSLLYVRFAVLLQTAF